MGETAGEDAFRQRRLRETERERERKKGEIR